MTGLDPRKYEMWDESRLIARHVLEVSLGLDWQRADRLAEDLADAMLGHFVTQAEADSSVVFLAKDGTGPFCSWCGRIPGPHLPPDHIQYGVFCNCRRKEQDEDAKAEQTVAQ
ncbi:hypothetical protein ACFXJ8_26275 [Nonomuraea sp. NPDC059194]|uniref:hypothetical protein n=1 Tax=Nonomuraea sp. NPDC059194 TaxID=3346764 RepID=UPI0036B0A006